MTPAIALKNLFKNLPDASKDEVFTELLLSNNMKIERIVSKGQSTEAVDWLEQDLDEWVLLLEGGAEILFDGENENRKMSRGDYLFIPAHTKHRVESTEKDKNTIWLAIHFRKEHSTQLQEAH